MHAIKELSLFLRRKKIQKNIQLKFVKINVCVLFIYLLSFYFIKKKKIGIIGIGFGNNIGNNLLKYAIFIKLKELGFDPYIVGNLRKNANIG